MTTDSISPRSRSRSRWRVAVVAGAVVVLAVVTAVTFALSKPTPAPKAGFVAITDPLGVVTATAARDGHPNAGPIRLVGRVNGIVGSAGPAGWFFAWIDVHGSLCEDTLNPGGGGSLGCNVSVPASPTGVSLVPLMDCSVYNLLGGVGQSVRSVRLTAGSRSVAGDTVAITAPGRPTKRLFFLSLNVGDSAIASLTFRGYDASGDLVIGRTLIDTYHHGSRTCP